jgi:hypothetical protein
MEGYPSAIAHVVKGIRRWSLEDAGLAVGGESLVTKESDVTANAINLN